MNFISFLLKHEQYHHFILQRSQNWSLYNNTYLNLKKAGHNFTLRQVEESIKNLDKYYKARTYKEQKHLFLKTVTGLMTTYQADIFMIKHMTLIKFVALINVESRKAYVYHLPNLRKKQ